MFCIVHREHVAKEEYSSQTIDFSISKHQLILRKNFDELLRYETKMLLLTISCQFLHTGMYFMHSVYSDTDKQYTAWACLLCSIFLNDDSWLLLVVWPVFNAKIYCSLQGIIINPWLCDFSFP